MCIFSHHPSVHSIKCHHEKFYENRMSQWGENIFSLERFNSSTPVPLLSRCKKYQFLGISLCHRVFLIVSRERAWNFTRNTVVSEKFIDFSWSNLIFCCSLLRSVSITPHFQYGKAFFLCTIRIMVITLIKDISKNIKNRYSNAMGKLFQILRWTNFTQYVCIKYV